MASAATVVLSYSPAGPQFAISGNAVMPRITVTATLLGVVVDPRAPPSYQWNATLAFDGAVAPHGTGRLTAHSAMAPVVGPSNSFVVPFAEVRGGVLTVSVSVRVGSMVLTARSAGLTVIGSNPTPAAIGTVAPAKPRFRKLMRLESALRQFTQAGWPLFSGDNLGGVGLCQITRPAPTADQTWNWKSNVAAGWSLYQSKEVTARGYPQAVRTGATFRALVTAWNDARPLPPATPALPGVTPQPRPAPIAITLPDYTAEQLDLDTLRGFNGYAGQLHEFRVRLDRNGLLVVTLDASGQRGAAEWERVSTAERIAHYDAIGLDAKRRGDPGYVDDVEAQAGF